MPNTPSAVGEAASGIFSTVLIMSSLIENGYQWLSNLILFFFLFGIKALLVCRVV